MNEYDRSFEGERGLVSAIILLAVKDYKQEKCEKAKEWLQESHEAFMYCEMLGVDISKILSSLELQDLRASGVSDRDIITFVKIERRKDKVEVENKKYSDVYSRYYDKMNDYDIFRGYDASRASQAISNLGRKLKKVDKNNRSIITPHTRKYVSHKEFEKILTVREMFLVFCGLRDYIVMKASKVDVMSLMLLLSYNNHIPSLRSIVKKINSSGLATKRMKVDKRVTFVNEPLNFTNKQSDRA